VLDRATSVQPKCNSRRGCKSNPSRTIRPYAYLKVRFCPPFFFLLGGLRCFFLLYEYFVILLYIHQIHLHKKPFRRRDALQVFSRVVLKSIHGNSD
jgi:hypothetical protein